MIDFSTLTMAEVSVIEDLSGMSITALGDEEAPRGKAMAAIAFIVKRRENPAYTFNDAMGLTMGELNDILATDEDASEPGEE